MCDELSSAGDLVGVVFERKKNTILMTDPYDRSQNHYIVDLHKWKN